MQIQVERLKISKTHANAGGAFENTKKHGNTGGAFENTNANTG